MRTERGDRCGTCFFWQRGGAQNAKALRDPGVSDGAGTCQCLPPAPVKIVGGWVEAVFPLVHESRFCGEWKAAAIPGENPDDGDEHPGSDDTVVPFTRPAA